MDLVEVSKRQGDVNRHPWELSRFEVVNRLLKNILKNETGFTVLDIGCGDIFFVSKLCDRYPKASFYAIDIAFTDEIISMLKPQIQGKNIYLFKSMEEAALHLKKSADLVLLLDVVEHISDDKGFLLDLYNSKNINKDTSVMITVPAYKGLFCSHDHFLGHYRRYTNTSLLKVIEQAGFKKINMGYFFFSLIPPRILQVFKEKISKPDLSNSTTGLVEWNKGQGLTAFIKNILLIDFGVTNFIKKISGLSLPGLSNYIICKKPV
jgi:trans-aconitate methyltransferase